MGPYPGAEEPKEVKKKLSPKPKEEEKKNLQVKTGLLNANRNRPSR